MSAEVSKRSVAEARRQKLLARGKDRLSQITGGQPPSKQLARTLALSQHALLTPGFAVEDAGAEAAGLQLYEAQVSVAEENDTKADSQLLASDPGLTRSRSLPSKAATLLDATQTEQASAAELTDQQPKSPPPNTLWNTPRASDRYPCAFVCWLSASNLSTSYSDMYVCSRRENVRSESSKAFSFQTEEPKLETWAKYDQQDTTATNSTDTSNVKIVQISWHQVLSSTHHLRLDIEQKAQLH